MAAGGFRLGYLLPSQRKLFFKKKKEKKTDNKPINQFPRPSAEKITGDGRQIQICAFAAEER